MCRLHYWVYQSFLMPSGSYGRSPPVRSISTIGAGLITRFEAVLLPVLSGGLPTRYSLPEALAVRSIVRSFQQLQRCLTPERTRSCARCSECRYSARSTVLQDGWEAVYPDLAVPRSDRIAFPAVPETAVCSVHFSWRFLL